MFAYNSWIFEVHLSQKLQLIELLMVIGTILKQLSLYNHRMLITKTYTKPLQFVDVHADYYCWFGKNTQIWYFPYIINL